MEKLLINSYKNKRSRRFAAAPAKTI